ncbi:MAG: hypothetical protein AABY13_05210, partial [Nanoarchaeota archaeon]
MSKRGQITVFIILGLLALVGIALFTYITARAPEGQPTPTQPVSGQNIVQNVNSFVITCIRTELAPLVWEMGAKGGTLSPRQPGVHDRRREIIDAWCNEALAGRICDNQARTREGIEAELAAELETRLPACLAKLNDVVKGGAINPLSGIKVVVAMNPLDMMVRLQYHFKAQFSGAEQEFNEFTTTEAIPFGRMVQLGTDIINQEATTSIFNKDQWMYSNGSDILLQKERPYPDIVYNLSTHVPSYENITIDGFRLGPLILTFAVDGQDTAGTVVRRLERQSGCCVMPTGGCRANIDQSSCSADGGTYNNDDACSCPAQAQPVVTGCCQASDKSCSLVTKESECKGTFYAGDRACRKPEEIGGVSQACTNTGCNDLAYNYDDTYGARRNGDSWCTQDTITGFGMDMVGSRHYVHSCINGKEYVEPCRDFREEICVGKTDQVTGSLVASCKLNRWYDCASQTTADSCQDLGERDCMWLPALKVNGQPWPGAAKDHPAVLRAKTHCVPWVPPGFKFWKPLEQNKAVCSQTNKNPIFNPGPRAQGFSILRICANLGDCGNKRNYVGEITKKGYSNPVGKPKQWHYDRYTAEGFENPIKAQSSNPFFNAIDRYKKFYDIRRQIFEWIPDATWEEVMSVDLDDDARIATTIKSGAIRCKPWVAPKSTQDCDLCDDDPLRPCTEYRCKSLGKCKWNWDDGVGTCDEQVVSADSIGPTIALDEASIPADTHLSVAKLSDSPSRYKITPAVGPNQRVAFTLTTSEDAECAASFSDPDPNQPAIEDFHISDLDDPVGLIARMVTIAAFEIPIGSGSPATRHVVDFVVPALPFIEYAKTKV